MHPKKVCSTRNYAVFEWLSGEKILIIGDEKKFKDENSRNELSDSHCLGLRTCVVAVEESEVCVWIMKSFEDFSF